MAFFALQIPVDICQKLAVDLRPLQKKWPEAQWVHPEDYHVTLRFIGSLSVEAVANLLTSLKGWGLPFTPFSMSLQGLCSFPARRDRGVLWIGLQDIAPELLDLQQRLEQQVQDLGWTAESRPFTPHLTIARFHASDAESVEASLPDFATRRWATLACQEYVLMKRRSGAKDQRSGPLYEVLTRFSV